MIVYGVALLSACLVLGMLLGEAIRRCSQCRGQCGRRRHCHVVSGSGEQLTPVQITGRGGSSGSGIKFWSAMYIPIVVAMASQAECCGCYSKAECWLW